jgi:hypothetical protein
MAYTPPKVFYSTTYDGTYTELTNIQAITIVRGRQRFVDPFQGSQCIIELIPANTYAIALAVGQVLDIRSSNSGSSPAMFCGQITDVQRSYGIPYNAANTPNAPADRIILTVTGGTGVLGGQILDFALPLSAGADAVGSASQAVSGVQTPQGYNSFDPVSGVTISGVTFPVGSTALDLQNVCLRTAQWSIDDGDTMRTSRSGPYNSAVMYYPASATGTTITFSDAGTVGAYRYNEIEYLSSIQQTFGSVGVKPDGLAAQFSTASGDFKNTIYFTTVDQTTTQAANLALYIRTTANQTTPVPFVIRTSTAVADGVDVLARLETYPVGTAVNVIFRGTSVTATVQGWSFAFYPDRCNVQAFMSASLGTPFTLDSTSFGVLDTNRLGYP